MDRIAIDGPTPGSPRAEIRFKLYGENRCVFSQLSRTRAAPASTSMDLTPKIVAEIGRRVGRNPATMRFFDLQTPRACGARGQYEFDEVVIDQSGSPNWQPLRCPKRVARDFLSHAPRPEQRLLFQPIARF